MSDFEEETYSTIFTSLKHPVRRKILRMLSEKPRNFSEILEALGISSSHLTYHLENLGELVSKTGDGKYKLSTFGEAAVGTMSKVEEAPKVTEAERPSSLSIKWKSLFVVLMIGLVVLAGVSYTQYWSLNRLSAKYEQLSAEYEQLSAEYEKLKDLVVWFIKPGIADGSIYIRSNGSVEGTDKIQRDGNVYTFTDNIYEGINVQRDNIVVDGAGYTLQGTGAFTSTGIDLTGGSNITIKNMEIRAFYYGIRLYESSNNSISGNTITSNEKSGIYLHYSSDNTISVNSITNNEYGIRFYGSSNNSVSGNTVTNNEWDGIDLWFSSSNSVSGNNIRNNSYGIYFHSSSDNTISGNNIKANNEYGIYLWRSSNNYIYHNNFVDNTQQVNIHSSTTVWDDGAGKGNYWSNYEDRYPDAEETDESGIWDTPYVIDENNQDNYPLMNLLTPEEEVPFWMQWWFWTIVAAGIVALAGTIYFLKKRKPSTPTAS